MNKLNPFLELKGKIKVIELEILKDVVKKLALNKIEYMISDSTAMNFYSIPRMTRDIDIVISINSNSIDKIFDIFKDDYYIDREDIKDAIKNETMFNIIHLKEVFKIDFIIRKSNEYRILEFKNKKRMQFDGIDIYIVSIEDLIISKLYWAKDSESEIQIGDAKRLIKNDFNYEYVKKWCSQLGISFLLERIINS